MSYLVTYWICFSFLIAFDDIIYPIFYFIPGYYILKLLLLVVFFHPKIKGSKLIYLFLKHIFTNVPDLYNEKKFNEENLSERLDKYLT